MKIQEFFDVDTWTLTYIVWDETTKDAIILDPVWNYDPAASRISNVSVNEVVNFIQSKQLYLHTILETHAHADHLTAAVPLKEHFPEAKLAISERVCQVQKTFKAIYNFTDWFKTDGSQFDLLLKDFETYSAGALRWKVLPTPGHTPACASYFFAATGPAESSAIFTGDALFMPDYGTGRCDFPDGDSGVLYDSITQNLYTLPDETRVYTGHDYRPGGRPLRFASTIGEEKKANIQLKTTTTRDDFIRFRNERDKTLAAPRLLLPSIQVNINGGHVPPTETNGAIFLKIPLFGIPALKTQAQAV